MASISALSPRAAVTTIQPVRIDPGASLLERATRFAARAGEVALDVIAVLRADDQANLPVSSTVTIARSPEAVYWFVRRLSRLPRFIDYLHAVREADDTYSHWVAKLPDGDAIAWDVKITDDMPGESIAWRSVQGSRVETRGWITFARAPGDGGTEVRLELRLGGASRRNPMLAKLFTQQQLDADVWRLKQLLEA